MNRKKKGTRRTGPDLRFLMIPAACVVALIVAMSVMLVVKRNAAQTQREEAYYVEGGETEVLAPPYIVNEEVKEGIMTEEEIAAAYGSTVAPLEERPDRTFTITCTGDVTIGGDVNGSSYKQFKEAVEKHGTDWFFANFRSIFEADDLTLVNFETVLTTETKQRSGRPYHLKGDPENVAIVANSSVEVCNVANNHGLDFLETGLEDCVSILEANGMSVCGFGRESIREVDGLKIGFLGFNTWDHTEKEMAATIKDMDSRCDVLIVSMHWGTEKEYKTESDQRELGHLAVDNGADLVVGTHTHVPGGIENYKGVQILYSLGNFCFGGNEHPYDTDSYIYQQTFTVDKDNNISFTAKIWPISVSGSTVRNDYQPRLLTGSDADRVLTKIAKNSDSEALALIEAVRE